MIGRGGGNALRLWTVDDIAPHAGDIWQERLYCVQWISGGARPGSRPESFFASVTAEDMEREKEIYRAQATATGKPAPVIEKIVEGKMSKFYEEVCLLDQPFIKEQTVTIGQLIGQKVGKLGENITVRRFARFKVGDPNWTVAQTNFTEQAAE